ncbi:MAG: phosphatase PAP2 family protein [Anaerolineae bacterium]
MAELLELEIEAILWLREALPGLVGVFEIFTFMGNELFFLMLLPLVYWCLDRRTGARLTVLFLLSAYVNSAAKALFNQPRPLAVAPERLAHLFRPSIEAAIARYEATGNGFPSGHTQNTTVIWGYLATQVAQWRATSGLRRLFQPLILALCALLLVLIPLSRVYLAVHLPRDLVGGYIVGIALLALALWLLPRSEAWLEGVGLAGRLGLAVGLPAVLIVLLPGEAAITTGATLMGMGVGFALERRWVRFDDAGALWRRALRYLLGIVVMVGLYAGLKAAFATLPVLPFRFVRYAAMGLWGGLGAPWAFVQLRLAQRQGRGRRPVAT